MKPLKCPPKSRDFFIHSCYLGILRNLYPHPLLGIHGVREAFPPSQPLEVIKSSVPWTPPMNVTRIYWAAANACGSRAMMHSGSRAWEGPRPSRRRRPCTGKYTGETCGSLETRWWFQTFLEFSPRSLAFHDPIWRMHIFQMGWLKPPTSEIFWGSEKNEQWSKLWLVVWYRGWNFLPNYIRIPKNKSV